MLPDPAPVRLAWSVREAAQAAGISERTMWTLVAAGAVPVARIGRRTLVRVADLDAYLASLAAPAGEACE